MSSYLLVAVLLASAILVSLFRSGAFYYALQIVPGVRDAGASSGEASGWVNLTMNCGADGQPDTSALVKGVTTLEDVWSLFSPCAPADEQFLPKSGYSGVISFSFVTYDGERGAQVNLVFIDGIFSRFLDGR